MFHSSTTLWRNNLENPLGAAEGRRVFKMGLSPAENIGNIYGKIGSFGKNAKDIAGAIIAPIKVPLEIATFPVTAPTRIGWWGLKKAYTGVVKPAFKAGTVVVGTGVEAGIGVKEATVDPAITIAKAPVRNLKMNLVDIPVQVLKSVLGAPKKIIEAPGRAWRWSKKRTAETKKKVIELGTKTRGNVMEVLKNVGEFKPIKTLKSLAKTVRCAIRQTIVDPVVGTAKNIWAPIGYAMGGPIETAKLFIESKWQYLTSMWAAAKQFRGGVERILNAPGKQLNTGGIKKWWKEVSPEEKKPAAAGAAPASAPKPPKKKSGKKDAEPEPENDI